MTFVIFRHIPVRNYAAVGVTSVLRSSAAGLVLACLLALPALAQEGPDGARRVTEKSAPVYPDLARRLNLVGVVKLRVTVAPDGTPKHVEALGGNPVLLKAAQDAVRTWRWAAAPQETKEEVLLSFRPR